jgi:hypothetical protein
MTCDEMRCPLQYCLDEFRFVNHLTCGKMNAGDIFTAAAMKNPAAELRGILS